MHTNEVMALSFVIWRKFVLEEQLYAVCMYVCVCVCEYVQRKIVLIFVTFNN